MRQKIIIDTDPSIGYWFRDVDDALAIMYLLAFNEDFDCLGITTVHGNASVKKTYKKALELLKLVGREDIPVYIGAKSRASLGHDTPASIFLKEMARTYPGEITILSIGPLTNLATAGMTDLSFFESLKRIVMMGGTFKKGLGIPPVSPFEFNFFKDPLASEKVLASPCPKILIPAELCQQVLFTRIELIELREIPNRIAGYLTVRIAPWLNLNTRIPFLPWKGGFVPWDLVAAVYLRRPEVFSGEHSGHWRLSRGICYSGTLAEAPEKSGVPLVVPGKVDSRAVLDEFFEAVRRFSPNPRAPQ